MQRWIVVLLAGGLLTACTAADPYAPALPDPALPLEQGPLCPTFRVPQDLLLQPIAEEQPLPPEMPGPDEWQYWQPQRPTKRECWGKGKKRTCRDVAIPTVEAANQDATVRATRATMGPGSRAMVRFKYQPDKIYEVLTSPRSPTFLFLPPGESLAAPPPINNNVETPHAWSVAWAEQRKQQEDRQEVIMVRPVGNVPERPFEPYETTTGLLLRSGDTIYVKLVATESTSTVSVSWERQTPPKPPEIPIEQRPPKIELTRIHTAYRLEPQGKVTPPWMPIAIFDDGTRTFIKFREALTYTRAPSAYGLTTKGAMALVQSHMFTRPQQPDQGAVLVVQGLWPALELKDTTGLTLKIVRQSTPAPATKEVSYAPTPTPQQPAPPEQSQPRRQPIPLLPVKHQRQSTLDLGMGGVPERSPDLAALASRDLDGHPDPAKLPDSHGGE